MAPDPIGAAEQTAIVTAVPPGAAELTAPQSQEMAESARKSSQQVPCLDGDPTVSSSPAQQEESKRLSFARLVPGYHLLHSLGKGTYGEVWLAVEDHTGIQVAIKFLNRELGHQWQLLQAEVRQLAMLQDDTGIVQLKDFDPDAERPFYVMAYAERGCLAKRLKQQGPLPVAEALAMFRRIAKTLAYVHAKGIRHCDLKPGNILLDAMGRPRVADFGQAHLASDMSPALGTFFYMAPEQADLTAHIADTRWDVYGLGAIFYAMLTGHAPHKDETLEKVLEQTEQLSHRLSRYREGMQNAKPLTAHRRLPGMDGDLADILERCLAIDPAIRYASAEAVLAALDRRKRRRRQRAILCAGIFGPVLLLITLGALGWWEGYRACKKSEDSLRSQAFTNYNVSARLAAVKVKASVVGLLQHLEKEAKELNKDLALAKQLKTPPAPGEEHPRIQKLLAKFKNGIPNDVDSVVNVCLFDRQGNMAGMDPLDDNKNLLGKNYAWRSYFHGGWDGWDASAAKGLLVDPSSGKPYTVYQHTHISHPFEAQNANRDLMVVLSTPVRAGDGTISGRLTVSVSLKALNNWLEEIKIQDGFPVLINDQYNILKHRSDDPDERWRPVGGNKPPTFAEPLYTKVFNRDSNADSTPGPHPERDPITDTDYVAGSAPIEFSGADGQAIAVQKWAVLVQVKHDKVIEPAVTLENEMMLWGGVMLAVALAMILSVWLGLLWLLRREERFAHG